MMEDHKIKMKNSKDSKRTGRAELAVNELR